MVWYATYFSGNMFTAGLVDDDGADESLGSPLRVASEKGWSPMPYFLLRRHGRNTTSQKLHQRVRELFPRLRTLLKRDGRCLIGLIPMSPSQARWLALSALNAGRFRRHARSCFRFSFRLPHLAARRASQRAAALFPISLRKNILREWHHAISLWVARYRALQLACWKPRLRVLSAARKCA